MITRDSTPMMKHEEKLLKAAATGFKTWLSVDELKAFVDAERERVSTTPEIYVVAFNKNSGYVKLDVGVVKLISEINEVGDLLDIEVKGVYGDGEPITFNASVFQPGVHPTIQYCRLFKTSRERDSYFEDIRFMSDLSGDYQQAMVNAIRRATGH